MTTEERIAQLEGQVAEMQMLFNGLKNASQIDPLLAKTIGTILTGTSSKTPASATRAVNEAGAGTYNVMFPPTGFINIGGFDVPYI